MIREYGDPRLNDTDRGKQKNLSQCHSVRHKSHMNLSSQNPSLRGERPATNRLSYDTATCCPWRHCCGAVVMFFHTKFKCSKPFLIVSLTKLERIFRKTLYVVRGRNCIIFLISVTRMTAFWFLISVQKSLRSKPVL
jgi:hypothetical protein